MQTTLKNISKGFFLRTASNVQNSHRQLGDKNVDKKRLPSYLYLSMVSARIIMKKHVTKPDISKSCILRTLNITPQTATVSRNCVPKSWPVFQFLHCLPDGLCYFPYFSWYEGFKRCLGVASSSIKCCNSSQADTKAVTENKQTDSRWQTDDLCVSRLTPVIQMYLTVRGPAHVWFKITGE